MPIRILIVGGVAGGATAAARARRLDEWAEIVLLERGQYISFANCGLPYYVGQVIKERDDLLVTTPEAFRDRYNIDIRLHTVAQKIDREARELEIKDLISGRVYRERYDKLILSPGAAPVKPPLPGVDLEGIYSLRNIPDSDRIKALVDRDAPESAVVVGGGFIGLEMAENLVERGLKTTIVEMLDQVLPPLDFEMAGLVQNHLEEKGLSLVLGTGVEAFEKSGDRLVVRLGNVQILETDMVILSVGVRPENELAKEAGLELGPRGHIKVNGAMATSDPDIFAVGDAVEVRDLVTGLPTATALAGPANKQGRIAADNALGRRSVFRGTLGTAVVKVFDLTAASTGAGQKTLDRAGVPYLVNHTHNGSHASYYPGAELMAIKLIFAPGSGRLLGAQIVGGRGVDKRIDVLATAIRANLTVFDLEELELAYAPPFSSAKDPVNIAGFAAVNALKGDVNLLQWPELEGLDPELNVLIDVRTQEEVDELGQVDGAMHIPIDQLRSRLHELDPEKNYLLYCAMGLRAYVGCRIMTQHGYKTKNISGGFRTLQGARH